jgi:aldose 1-epimerase
VEKVTLVSAAGALKASFVPDAGMLCSSLRDRGEELLGQGSGVAAYALRNATMGIPLLYPWANRLAQHRFEAAGQAVELVEGSPQIAVDPNGLPIHGVIPAELGWQVDRVCADRSALSASLAWDGSSLLKLFPFPHRLAYEAEIHADSLTIAVAVHASGGARVPVSFGFHPYLSIGAGDRAQCTIDLPVTERVVLDETMIPTGARQRVELRGVHLGDSAWDDAFAGIARPAKFIVSTPRRTLGVEFIEGYRYAQVYSPADSDFVCFEPMTAPTNALVSGEGLTVLEPGETYRAEFRVVVGPVVGVG